MHWPRRCKFWLISTKYLILFKSLNWLWSDSQRILFNCINLHEIIHFWCSKLAKGHDLIGHVAKVKDATLALSMAGIPSFLAYLGCVRLGSIWNKNNWNNANKRLFGSYSHSGIPGFHTGYSAPRSRIAGIYSGIHSHSGIFPNERALSVLLHLPTQGGTIHWCQLMTYCKMLQIPIICI